MAVFSNQRVSALTDRIGSEALRELVNDLENVLVMGVCSNNDSSPSGIDFQSPVASVDVASPEAALYLDCQSVLALAIDGA